LLIQVQHITIGKSFASKNNYRLDESQELAYLGITNFFNSYFGAMTVGGVLSRTAVNSDAGVKSPLNGLFTSGFVLLGIYKLSGALFWIPQATLAAVIVTAVAPVFIGPAASFYKYWRTSFADFVACMICFWVTLFVSAEIGIASGVAFTVAWTLLKAAFVGVRILNASSAVNGQGVFAEKDVLLQEVPEDTKVFLFEDSIFFANAKSVEGKILDVVKVWHESSGNTEVTERSWSVAQEMRIKRLKELVDLTTPRPRLRVVVFDFARVSDIDTTGIHIVEHLRKEIHQFAGELSEIRFVNLDDGIRKRFERFGWIVIGERDLGNGELARRNMVVVYESLVSAVTTRSNIAWDDDGGEGYDEKQYIEIFETV
jgi:sodium-independent sulfate anion transporter 11